MNSYLFDIGERARKASRFVGRVRTELQRALLAEKKTRKLTQQDIAQTLGVNRSVINRQLIGTENLTIRRVAELAWAMGWEIDFKLRKAVSEEDHLIVQGQAQGNISNLTNPASSDRPLITNNSMLVGPATSSSTNDNYLLVEVAA